MPQTCSVEARFFRALNRIVVPPIRAGWGSPRFVPGGLIVLETKGRRTGRRSKVPLAAIRLQGHTVVSTFRGHRSQWIRNLIANPTTRYWLGGRARRAKALVITPQSRPRNHSELSPPVRFLVRALVPYTYGGWAFAILSADAG